MGLVIKTRVGGLVVETCMVHFVLVLNLFEFCLCRLVVFAYFHLTLLHAHSNFLYHLNLYFVFYKFHSSG